LLRGAAAAFHAHTADVAALPRSPRPATQTELLQANLKALSEIGPVPAYLAHLSMSDEESDLLMRETFDRFAAPELRRKDDLQVAAQALAKIVALMEGKFEDVRNMARKGQAGAATAGLTERIFEAGTAMLRRLERLPDADSEVGRGT
jgi:hypothetical protein